jgi:NADP-dependent 3-hydroxy acid dehydrogenase YdfG
MFALFMNFRLILAARGADALNEVAANCKAIDSSVKVCVVVADVGKQEDCKCVLRDTAR